MRILQVSAVLCDEHGGGVGDYVCSLSRGLAERGHDVEVLACLSGPLKHPSHPYRIQSVKIWSTPIVRYLQWGRDANIRIRELLEERPFDLVHAHTTSMAFPLFYRSKVPMILTSHSTSFDPFHGRFRRILLRLAEKSCYDKATRVIAISQAIRHELVGLGISPTCITVLPNGTDRSRFRGLSKDRETTRCRLGISQDEIVFLYVGSLIKRKGFDILLQAVDRVFQSERNDAYRFLFVGHGPLLTSALQLSHRYESVYAFGFVSEKDLGEIYRASDVFVIPSLYEGMPTVLLDAIGFGLPVLASDIPVHREVLSAECATFARPADIESLTRAFVSMADQKSNFPEMRMEAQKISEQYSWENLVPKIVRLYESVL